MYAFKLKTGTIAIKERLQTTQVKPIFYFDSITDEIEVRLLFREKHSPRGTILGDFWSAEDVYHVLTISGVDFKEVGLRRVGTYAPGTNDLRSLSSDQ
jgi:hypothetical protein